MARTVTLVDTAGKKTGTADLLEAHTGMGMLHKAFSVYVFRASDGKLLIQKRSPAKMLWPLFWANSCCSHPFENESPTAAGERRLQEELGFTCPLRPDGEFVYRAEDPAGRGVEHEHVTILIGKVDTDPRILPDPKEVIEYTWMDPRELTDDMHAHPDDYAPWLKLGLRKVLGAN